MQRVKITNAAVEWISEVLDMKVRCLDELKSGHALIQLVHSIAPESFDLARCDFFASTAYHFERNLKLLQEVMKVNDIQKDFIIERLMEGERNGHRDLMMFVVYFSHHYETLKMQHRKRILKICRDEISPKKGVSPVVSATVVAPEVKLPVGKSVVKPAGASSAMPKGAVTRKKPPLHPGTPKKCISSSPQQHQDPCIASKSPLTDPAIHPAYVEACRLQDEYNPVHERKKAIDRRKAMFRTSISSDKAECWSVNSSDASLSMFSAYTQSGMRIVKRNKLQRNPFRDINSWVKQVHLEGDKGSCTSGNSTPCSPPRSATSHHRTFSGTFTSPNSVPPHREGALMGTGGSTDELFFASFTGNAGTDSSSMMRSDGMPTFSFTPRTDGNEGTLKSHGMGSTQKSNRVASPAISVNSSVSTSTTFFMECIHGFEDVNFWNENLKLEKSAPPLNDVKGDVVVKVFTFNELRKTEKDHSHDGLSKSPHQDIPDVAAVDEKRLTAKKRECSPMNNNPWGDLDDELTRLDNSSSGSDDA